MTDVLEAEISVSKRRIGRVVINHEGLIVCCDICLYKDQKLWIRMPEIWLDNEKKLRLVFWETQQISDEKQEIILNKVLDILDLDIEKAKKLKKDFFTERKELTKQENKFTLQRKNAEV